MATFYESWETRHSGEPVKRVYTIFLLLITVWSCQQPADNNKTATAVTDAREQGGGLAVVPELKNVDSLQILYYDDPDGDSLRYTRFYTYTATSDSALINVLLKNLDAPFDQRSEIRDCRSEGKIYLFGKEKPVKTVYFSTRCNTCCHLYFIRNGEFLYFKIGDEMIEALHRNKPDK